ncbi:MAG: hypothetical protein ABIS27_13150, partial [Longimicrobiales bacterium]
RLQTTEAAQLGQAAQTTTADLAVLQSGPPPSTATDLATSIALDLNPSPATTIATSQQGSSVPGQSGTVGTERQSPTNEGNTAPTISQAKKATVVITIPNPTAKVTAQVRKGGN